MTLLIHQLAFEVGQGLFCTRRCHDNSLQTAGIIGNQRPKLRQLLGRKTNFSTMLARKLLCNILLRRGYLVLPGIMRQVDDIVADLAAVARRDHRLSLLHNRYLALLEGQVDLLDCITVETTAINLVQDTRELCTSHIIG